MLAYSWGSLFNLAFAYIETTSRGIVTTGGLTSGFNAYTWLYSALTAVMGLSVSFMYKYQDNVRATRGSKPLQKPPLRCRAAAQL